MPWGSNTRSVTSERAERYWRRTHCSVWTAELSTVTAAAEGAAWKEPLSKITVCSTAWIRVRVAWGRTRSTFASTLSTAGGEFVKAFFRARNQAGRNGKGTTSVKNSTGGLQS